MTTVSDELKALQKSVAAQMNTIMSMRYVENGIPLKSVRGEKAQDVPQHPAPGTKDCILKNAYDHLAGASERIGQSLAALADTETA
ncbi:MAG: hypothetical protein SVY53_05090 [Chloroflexota bacterium]|nr:hypothetical protein [Chloroflexota bacterium]